jgi:hypothetical protein
MAITHLSPTVHVLGWVSATNIQPRKGSTTDQQEGTPVITMTRPAQAARLARLPDQVSLALADVRAPRGRGLLMLSFAAAAGGGERERTLQGRTVGVRRPTRRARPVGATL